jgi:hypothetical protein
MQSIPYCLVLSCGYKLKSCFFLLIFARISSFDQTTTPKGCIWKDFSRICAQIKDHRFDQ